MSESILDKKVLLQQILKRQRIQADKLVITTNSVHYITFKHVIDAYLHLQPVKSWEWQDWNAEKRSKSGLIAAVFKIAWDVISWPFFYSEVLISANNLQKEIGTRAIFSAKHPLKVLYIRSDHWFNIKSGGSVGHVSGVINALKKLGHRVDVVTSDYLAEVEEDARFRRCAPMYSLSSNIPEGTELKYNKRLLTYIKQLWHNIQPDLIYQRYSLGNFVAIALKKLYRVPVITEYNGSFVWMSKNWGAKLIHTDFMTKIERINLAAADLVVVVSEVSRQELLERGFDESRPESRGNGPAAIFGVFFWLLLLGSIGAIKLAYAV
jgi:hypothetical protein